jgi:hypothetical protein
MSDQLAVPEIEIMQVQTKIALVMVYRGMILNGRTESSHSKSFLET